MRQPLDSAYHVATPTQERPRLRPAVDTVVIRPASLAPLVTVEITFSHGAQHFHLEFGPYAEADAHALAAKLNAGPRSITRW